MNSKINSEADAQRIAEFQISMAKETESLDLNPSFVSDATKFLIAHPQYGFYLGNKAHNIVRNERRRSLAACCAPSKIQRAGGSSQSTSTNNSVSRGSSRASSKT